MENGCRLPMSAVGRKQPVLTGRDRPSACKNTFVSGMPKPSALGRGRLGWNDAIKTQLCQVDFIDENVNHAQRIGAA